MTKYQHQNRAALFLFGVLSGVAASLAGSATWHFVEPIINTLIH